MSARGPTSPTRAISLPQAPSTSTTAPSSRKTSPRSVSAVLAICAASPPARRRSAPARCSPRSRTNSTTAPGMSPTTSARSTAYCATARAPPPTGSRCRRWPIPTAGIRPIRWRSAPIDHQRPRAASARLDPSGGTSSRFSLSKQLRRIRASTARARPTPMWCAVDAAVQQFHLSARRSHQWRPVQPARPPHALRIQRQPQL